MQRINAKLAELDAGRIIRHCLFIDNNPMSYRFFIEQLRNEPTFRHKFNTLLASAGFTAFRFETPVLSSNTIDEPFEFVLIDAPGLCSGTTDIRTFSQYFTGEEAIVKFKSLSADATLIVPSPIVPVSSNQNCYRHLAGFVRSAPVEQIDALWQVVGNALHDNTQPLWFNTEGSGVAWLHVRLDTRPKYYGYSPYKAA